MEAHVAFHSGCDGGSPRDAEHDTVKTLVIVKTADDTKPQSATVHVLGPRQITDGPIGPFDTLIAAHALRLLATLVTNNISEFSRVPGLQLDNWVPSSRRSCYTRFVSRMCGSIVSGLMRWVQRQGLIPAMERPRGKNRKPQPRP